MDKKLFNTIKSYPSFHMAYQAEASVQQMGEFQKAKKVWNQAFDAHLANNSEYQDFLVGLEILNK